MRTITNTTHTRLFIFSLRDFSLLRTFSHKRLHDRFQRKTESNWHIGQSGAASHSRAASWSFSVQTKSKNKILHSQRQRKKKKNVSERRSVFSSLHFSKAQFFALFSMHLTYFWYFTENFARQKYFSDKVEDSIRKKINTNFKNLFSWQFFFLTLLVGVFGIFKSHGS